MTDVKSTVGELVQKNTRNERPAGLIHAGHRRWKNVRYEIIGLMTRTIRVDHPVHLGEYLLPTEQGYAWFTEYNGHFNYAKTAAEIPKTTSVMMSRGPAVRYLGHTFGHFARSKAFVTYLVGEFYWTVKLQDEAMCNDYVDPPLMLSSESTGTEITWTIGEYVEGPELWKAFGLKGKPPRLVRRQPSRTRARSGASGSPSCVRRGRILANAVLHAAVAVRPNPSHSTALARPRTR